MATEQSLLFVNTESEYNENEVTIRIFDPNNALDSESIALLHEQLPDIQISNVNSIHCKTNIHFNIFIQVQEQIPTEPIDNGNTEEITYTLSPLKQKCSQIIFNIHLNTNKKEEIIKYHCVYNLKKKELSISEENKLIKKIACMKNNISKVIIDFLKNLNK